MKNATYDDVLQGSSTFKSRVVDQDPERFGSLAVGDSPKIVFLTSSDSRIDPCALTNTKPGDLFVIRNVGNIVPPETGYPCGELASLEFAVRGLRIEHVVVCGHSDCGAIKGMLAPESCAHLSHVSAWARLAQDARIALEGVGNDPKTRLEVAIRANVKLQLENLRTLDFVREAEEAGTLHLHGWVYNIANGAVDVVEEAKVALTAAV